MIPRDKFARQYGRVQELASRGRNANFAAIESHVVQRADETKRVLVQGITGKQVGAQMTKIDPFVNCDYGDHMTATLRETKAKLSEMVKLASQGEEVVITVHGKEVAKLVGLPRQAKKLDKKKWLAELAKLRRKYSTGRVTMTAQEIQDEDRAERF